MVYVYDLKVGKCGTTKSQNAEHTKSDVTVEACHITNLKGRVKMIVIFQCNERISPSMFGTKDCLSPGSLPNAKNKQRSNYSDFFYCSS